MIRVECIADSQSMQRLDRAWDDLLGRSRASCIFLTPEWLETWWQTYSTDGRLFLLAAWEGEILVGLAPFFIVETTRLGLVRVREIRFLGTGEVCSDYLDVIIEEGREADVCRAVMAFLWQHRGEWDRIVLTDVPEDSQTLKLAPPLGEGHGLWVRVTPWTRCPYMILPDRAEEVLGVMSSSSRKELNRKRKRLNEQGTVEFRVCSDEETALAGLEALIKLHQASWSARGQPGHFASERFSGFHRVVAPRLATRGYLYIAMLTMDGAAMAARYCFSFGKTIHAYLPGFDPAWSKYSVGVLLTAAAIEEAVSRGYREFDFLQGDESFKYRWASFERRNMRLILTQAGLRGLLCDGIEEGRASAKRALVSLGLRHS